MSLLDDLAAKLVSDGVGVLETSIFVSSRSILPDGDGPYLSVYETGGVAPTRVQNASEAATQRPTAQIVARGASYTAARALAQAAYDSLDGIFNTTLSGTQYLSMKARQEPTDTGLDEKGRVRVTFNIDVEKQPS